MSMKIERNGVAIVVETKDDLIAALQAIDEMNRQDRPRESVPSTHTCTHEVQTPEPVARPRTTRKYADKTISECVIEILRENENRSMHYRAIASVAMAGGYRGRNADDPERTVPRSFEQTMRRMEAIEAVGEGVFRIRE